ncbi:MAG: hypothetical protein BXU00_00040 [Candidatus Nanoclepta minutus]|uniref:FCP1 homology domain-containing protein n=1 Tax=Candidatus Nanoclepta minutus TaxID=1940235 RepID=A0A397WN32_9ARCH|nr:MAG: hypothetical protein BXU00_00040 [Candidatus Nanoclepta minutus]
MLLNRLKGVFIDLDGTLIDSLQVYRKAYEELFKKFGIVPDDRFYKNFGEGPVELANKIYSAYKDKLNISFEEFLKVRESILDSLISEIKFTPGAKEFLIYLKDKGFKIGIVTSSSRSFTEKVLDNLGLKGFFDVVITSDDVKNLKPDPEPYILALNRLKLLPDECLAIEDSIYGIISAKNAGINVIAVLTGANTKKEIKNLGVYKIMKNLKDLLKFFKDNLEVKDQ